MRAPSFVLPTEAKVATMIARLVLLTTLLLLLAERPARADGDHTARTRERAEATLKQAEAADAALELARARALYDEGRALDPGSSRAPRAEARAAILRSHSEGDLVPFTKLERLRRDPALSSDPVAVDALVHDAESFPPGLVRVEVWVLAAEAYAHRFGRAADADALLRRVVVDPHTDSVAAQKAARDLVALQLARGDLAAAQAAVRLAGGRADPQLGRDVQRLLRRRSIHLTALGALAAMALLAVRALVVAARRGTSGRARAALARTWKLAVAYAAYVAVGGALLASGYEAGTTRPFLYFGVVLVPIVLVARVWAATGGTTRGARAARAGLCGLGAMGAGFLVLEMVDVTFLEGMGL